MDVNLKKIPAVPLKNNCGGNFLNSGRNRKKGLASVAVMTIIIN